MSVSKEELEKLVNDAEKAQKQSRDLTSGAITEIVEFFVDSLEQAFRSESQDRGPSFEAWLSDTYWAEHGIHTDSQGVSRLGVGRYTDLEKTEETDLQRYSRLVSKLRPMTQANTRQQARFINDELKRRGYRVEFGERLERAKVTRKRNTSTP